MELTHSEDFPSENIDRLYTEICNHLALGQWELAKGCILVYVDLVKENDTDVDEKLNKIRNLLLEVATNPLLCIGSRSIESPLHLSWMCILLLEELGLNTDDLKDIRKDVEFKLMLQEAHKLNLDFFPYEEIYNIFANSFPKVVKNHISELPSQVKNFFPLVLERVPLLACLIYNALEVPELNEPDIILSWLLERCDIIKKMSEKEAARQEAIRILKVISVYVAHVKNAKVSGELCNELLGMCCMDLIELQEIYTSLLINDNAIKSFCQIENIVHNRTASDESLASKKLFLETVFLSHDQIKIKELFLKTVLNGIHFLELLMSSFVEMVAVKDFALVNRCLQHPLMAPLRPLVLLLSWNTIQNKEDAVLVLNALWKRNRAKDRIVPRLTVSCDRLMNEVEVADWCLKQHCLNPDALKQPTSFRELCLRLKYHSTLKVLNQFLHLSKIKEEEIEEIIQRLPTYIVKKREKSVKFVLSDSLPKLCSDFVIFQGYKIMVIAINAIICNSQKNNSKGINADFEEMRNCTHSDKDKMKIKSGLAEKFELLSCLITDLYPISFRIEILENLFSLLFVTRNHIVDDGASDTEYGNEIGEESSSAGMKPKSSLGRVATKEMTDMDAEKNSYKKEKSLSENASSLSTCSSCSNDSMIQVGFLCDEKIIEPLLTVIKNNLLEAALIIDNKEHAGPLTWEEFYDLENNSTTNLKCLSQAIARLKYYVNDAIWRYELVQSHSYSDEKDEIQKKNVIYPEPALYYLRSVDTQKKVKYYRSLKKSTVTELLPDQRNKRQSHYYHRLCRVSRCRKVSCQHEIMNRMMSSPKSLLHTCLLQQDLIKADQVIQTFSLHKTSSAAEVTFMKENSDLISQLDMASTAVFQHSVAKPLLPLLDQARTSSLSNLAQTAAEGLNATSGPAIVENLFTNCTPPNIPELIDLENQNKNILGIGDCQSLRAIAMADVVFTSCPSLHICASILSSAQRRVSSAVLSSVDISSYLETDGVGFIPFLQRMSDLVNMMMQKQKKYPLLTSSHFFTKHNCLQQYFIETLEPLSALDYSAAMDSYHQLSEAMDKFSATLRETKIKELNDVPSNLTSENKLALNKTFRNLVVAASELVGEGIICKEGNVEDNSEVKKNPDYLKSLFIYLRQLVAFFSPSGEFKSCPSEITYLEVLGMELHSMLGNLMLNNNVLPESIEKITDKLPVNLCDIIAKRLCGVLPVQGIIQCKHIESITFTNSGQRILNCVRPYDRPTRNPSLVAQELLERFIEVVKEFSKGKQVFTAADLIEVHSYEKLLPLFEDTSELGSVDLSLLKNSEDCIAFLINVVNVMHIHSMLLEKYCSVKNDYNLSHRLADICCDTYWIGQLGVVSLFELYSLLVGDYQSYLGLPQQMIKRMKKCFCCELALPNPGYIFALALGTLDSPKIQVVYPNIVNDQLCSAMNEYLNAHTVIDEIEVKIPQLMKFFKEKNKTEFYKEILKLNCNTDVANAIACYFAEYSDECGCDDKLFQVKLKNDLWGIVLDYTNISDFSPTRNAHWQHSLSVQQMPTAVQEYMKAKSPLTMHVIDLLSDEPTKDEEYEILNDFVQQFNHLPVVDILVPLFHVKHFWEKLEDFLISKDWLGMLNFIKTSLQLSPQLTLLVSPLKDYIYCNLTAQVQDELPNWTCARKIKDAHIRVNCVLSFYLEWPFDDCQFMLRFCHDSSLSDDLTKEIEICLKKIENYQMILHCDPSLNSWQNVAELSASNPESLCEQLMQQRQYQLALDWAKLHEISQSLKQLMDIHHLMFLLDSANPDLIAAERFLEIIESSEIYVQTCEQLYHQIRNVSSQEFVLTHLLSSEVSLTPEQKLQFTNYYMGIKIFQSLPSEENRAFFDIIAEPILMLEQLIMNLKIDYLTKIVKKIHDDEIIANYSVSILEEIDALLRRYCEKAIIVPRVMPSYPISGNISFGETLSKLTRNKDFTVPIFPPKKEEWEPDNAVTECRLCKQGNFTMLYRRHHCRRCGRVVCSDCSNHRRKVDGYGDVKVRVCDNCNRHETEPVVMESSLLPASFLERRARAYSVSQQENKSPSSLPSCSSSLSLVLNEEISWQLKLDEEHNKIARQEFNFEQIPNVHLCMSLLELHKNKKKCAYYLLDLCTSLLSELQSSNSKEEPSDQPNFEVDYELVTRMAETLLINAKLKFAELQDYEKISACDHIKTYITLTRILVQNNCHHLLPKDIGKIPEFTRQLQHLLIEEERWQLAVEVTSKVRRDAQGVWMSWGLEALKVGEFQTAREKFDRALGRFSDKRQSQYVSHVTDDIIAVLEKRLYSEEEQAGNILFALSNLKSIKEHGVAKMKFPKASGSKICPFIFEECLYYLKNYGSPLKILNFLIKHKEIRKALQTMLKEKWNSDVFINGILIPCGQMGELAKLEEEIHHADPSLKQLQKHLEAACQYLAKRSCFKVLLRFQVLLEDFDNAASTCVRLYCKDGQDYKILHDNLEYLYSARKNLETYLASHSETATGALKLSWSEKQFLPMHEKTKEVNRKIRAIDLQIELTKFLVQCNIFVTSLQDNKQPVMEQAAKTLFGNSAAKVEICALVLISGTNVESGFGLCYRIITEFMLNPVTVYSLCSRHLIKKQRSSEIKRLIECMNTSGEHNFQIIDEVLSNCIVSLVRETSENKEIHPLIKMMHSDEQKINAYILSGKLKSAYLLAVQSNRVADVQRITAAAERSGQLAVKNICDKWLAAQKNTS